MNATVATAGITGTSLPHFYDNYFVIRLVFGADTPQAPPVFIPRQTGLINTNLIIKRGADFDDTIDENISNSIITLSSNPNSVSWRLTKPNGDLLEQQTDWVAMFSVVQVFAP